MKTLTSTSTQVYKNKVTLKRFCGNIIKVKNLNISLDSPEILINSEMQVNNL